MAEEYPQITTQQANTSASGVVLNQIANQPLLQVTHTTINPSHVGKVDSFYVRDSLRTQEIVRPMSTKTEVADLQDTAIVLPETEQQKSENEQVEEGSKSQFKQSSTHPVLHRHAHTPLNSDWITIVLMLSMIILASVRVLFRNYLSQMFVAAVNNITANRIFKETNISVMHASFRVDIFAYIILALFGYQVALYYNIWPSISGFGLFATCVAVITLFFMLKIAVYKILGVFSREERDTEEYVFTIKLYIKVLGIFLFPLVLINNYASTELLESVVVIGFCVASVVYLMTLFRGVLIFIRKRFSIFYLILYLCTLEILPLILIFKVFLQKGK